MSIFTFKYFNLYVYIIYYILFISIIVCLQIPTSNEPIRSSVPKRDSHTQNLHVVNPDIKIHSVISSELDYNHDYAMTVALGECNDEQLLAEVARRHLGMIESSLLIVL